MKPELFIVINAREGLTHILRYEIDKRSAENLANAAESTIGLVAAGEVAGILANAIKAIEVLKPLPLDIATPEQMAQMNQVPGTKLEPKPGALNSGAFAMDPKPDINAVPITDFQLEQIAKACHDANAEYCRTLGDNSQVAWEDAPEWQKVSARNGVRYAIQNDFPEPEAMHEAWMKDKIAAGWVYGEVKDPNANPATHPSLRPYGELSTRERYKDELFRFVVKRALNKIPAESVMPVPPTE